MKEMSYIIKDEVGIHARPAGLLVKEAAKFTSKISVTKGEKTADAKKLFALMGLGVKCGEEIKIICDGCDEEEAVNAIGAFLKENL